MIQCTPEGIPFVKDPLISAAVKVPHKRQVLKAIREIHAGCHGTEQEELLLGRLETVCNFFGVTLEHVVNGS